MKKRLFVCLALVALMAVALAVFAVAEEAAVVENAQLQESQELQSDAVSNDYYGGWVAYNNKHYRRVTIGEDVQIEQHPAEWGDWEFDNESHSRRCTKCDIVEKNQHFFIPIMKPVLDQVPQNCEEGIITGGQWCLICQYRAYTREDKKAHDFKDWKLEDGVWHHECKNCDVCVEIEEVAGKRSGWFAEQMPFPPGPLPWPFPTPVVRHVLYINDVRMAEHDPVWDVTAKNENGHSLQCTNCTLKEENQAHDYEYELKKEADADKKQDGEVLATCKVCKYAKTIPIYYQLKNGYHEVGGQWGQPTVHQYFFNGQELEGLSHTAEWESKVTSYDKNGHYFKCKQCKLKRTEAHAFTYSDIVLPKDEKEGSAKATCTCGYVDNNIKLDPSKQNGYYENQMGWPPFTTIDHQLFINDVAQNVTHDPKWAATYDEAGHHLTCTVEGCNVTKTEGHQFTYTEVVPPTDNTNGSAIGICNNADCRTAYPHDIPVVLDHTKQNGYFINTLWGESHYLVINGETQWSTNHNAEWGKPESLNEDFHVSKCQRQWCYLEKTEKHTFDEWVFNEGRLYHECTGCGYKEEIKLDPRKLNGWHTTAGGIHAFFINDVRLSEFSHEAEWGEWDISPFGHSRSCAQCIIVERKIHQYTDWEEVTAPTFDKPGLKKRTCIVCGYVDEEYIPPIKEHKHEYTTVWSYDWYDIFTMTKRHEEIKVCDICGHKKLARWRTFKEGTIEYQEIDLGFVDQSDLRG